MQLHMQCMRLEEKLRRSRGCALRSGSSVRLGGESQQVNGITAALQRLEKE